MNNLDTKKQAEKLFKKVDTFILSCVDSDGYPMTKAVVPNRHRESLNEMYFATNTSSRFANAVVNNSKASVYFYNRGISWKGCYLKGEMEIIDDMTLKEKHWDDKYKDAYEEKSFTDPDYCLIKFIPRSGRLYADYTLEDFEI